VRLVLDSSVLIAAFISRAGGCAELLEEVLAHDALVLSEAILDEVTDKLADKFSFPASAIAEIRRARALRRAGGS
jgi:predicted nucleic acid-binding protein